MMAISADIRRVIVEAKGRKERTKNITKWTGVPKRTIDNIWRLYRETSDIKTKSRPGRPSRLSNADFDAIKAQIKKEPDITLEEIIENSVCL